MDLAPGRILGKVVEAAFEFNFDVSNFIAAVMHLDVVQASINRALQPHGVEDRRFQFLHSGFIPLPRGSTIQINNSLQARASINGKEAGPLKFEGEMMEFDQIVRGANEGEALPP